MAIETFGSPLSEVVQKQFYNRSKNNLRTFTRNEFVGSELQTATVAGDGPYLRKHLFNSSWINVISSVNDTKPDDNRFSNGDPAQLAKTFVLSGGALFWDGEKLVKRTGIDDKSLDGFSAAYNANTQNGIRPMPGITGFQIVSKSLYGTVREATISFVVWSPYELEIVEKLYLRPGYHVIVEWGHTYGLDQDGEESSFPVSTYGNYKNFFEENTADKIYEIIEDTREINDGNYDAFLGIIKNFSWTFRPDGGYDCSISVISKGEVLESLTVRSGLTALDTPISGSASEEFLETNILTRLVKVLKEAGNNTPFTNPPFEEGTFNISNMSSSSLNLYEDIGAELFNYSNANKDANNNDPKLGFVKGFRQKKSWWQSFIEIFGTKTDSTSRTTYIRLRMLLHFVNFYIRCSSTSKKPGEFSVEKDNQQKLFLFKNFVNLSPDICIVPQRPAKTFNVTSVTTGTLTGISFPSSVGALPLFPFAKLSKAVFELPDSDNILDILISVETVGKLLADFIRSLEDPEEFDIITFVKSLLKTIETNLGGINEFDIEYSEENNLYTVIDRRTTNIQESITDIPVLNVFGAGSIALDINIQTKITNKLGSQIAIAAQGPNAESQLNSSLPEFKKWNQNLIDRFDTSPRQNSQSPLFPTLTQEEIDFNTQIKNFQDKLIASYALWWAGRFEPEESYWTSLLTQGQTVYSMISSDFRTSEGLPPQGIIPTVLTLKVEGIGGIKIGQTFKINQGILPKRYNQFGYIITGVEHSIESNKWITSLKAQTYYLGKPTQEEIDKAKERLGRFDIFFDNVRKPTPSPLPLPSVPTPLLGTDAQRFWTLVAICATEDNNPQAWADVAQSIYNRAQVGATGQFYPSDVLKNILANGQYEPTWKRPTPGIRNIPNQQWKAIGDITSAAKATNLSPAYLNRVAQAIKDPSLQQKAATFIQGRTDFLGPGQRAINMTNNKSRVQRAPGRNQFGFSNNYFKPNGGSPAPVPNFVTNVKI